ncbi:MAG: LemA family protein [Helicobacteraceae bacterium]|jgi:LemA protein|nr:LemA family protein [Helicobacteraceae bacterium]
MTAQILISLGLAALLIVFYGVKIYNRLVELKTRVGNGFAQIEVQLKRRYDLIPNLVEAAKGYMKHERETLESVIAARNRAASALERLGFGKGSQNAAEGAGAEGAGVAGIAAINLAEGELMSALSRFNVVMEQYPDLKASENVLALQEEISGTENRVGFARQGFNDNVAEFNAYRKSFPQVIVANFTGFSRDEEFLQFADSAKIQDAPKVSFN